MKNHVCILGDLNPGEQARSAIDAARSHTVAGLRSAPTFEWVATDRLDLDDLGTRFQGLWVTPGSPYRDEDRVAAALTLARTSNLPTFGNCGGFQHMLLEITRNVAGVAGARHAENQTGPGPVVIAALACSLKGLTEELTIVPGTKLAAFVGEGSLVGRYFCSYAVNEAFVPALAQAGVQWTSFAGDQPRSFELPGHRFYVGCLFQPALDSDRDRPNPVIAGFLREVMR